MIMNVYYWIMVGLAAVSILIAANQHGKEKTGKHNFWGSAFFMILEIVLITLAVIN